MYQNMLGRDLDLLKTIKNMQMTISFLSEKTKLASKDVRKRTSSHTKGPRKVANAMFVMNLVKSYIQNVTIEKKSGLTK